MIERWFTGCLYYASNSGSGISELDEKRTRISPILFNSGL